MQLQGIGGAVNAFSSAAASGQVSVDADAAQDAITEIGNVKAELQTLLRQGSGESTSVQVGANPIGDAMARKWMSRWNGGDSFMAVLQVLLDQTERAEAALQQSIRNYVETDEGRATKFR